MSLDNFLKTHAPLTERERTLVIESWNTAYHEIEAAQQSVQADGLVCTCPDLFAADENGNCSWCHKPQASRR